MGLYTDGKFLGTTIGATFRSKIGDNEGSEKVLSCCYFDDDSDVNLECAGPGEGDLLGISKRIEYCKIEGPKGKVLGTIHGAEDRSKIGGDGG